MWCWNCVSASARMTYRISLPTWIPSGMSDTNVTAPPGLSVCCHLWGVSWAFASVSISQTVVRPENSYARPTLNHCQDNFVCKHFLPCSCSGSSCLFLPPFSSHLPPSSSPPVLHPLRSSVKFLTFVTKTRDCERVLGGVRAMAADGRDLWGLQACWTSYFPHQSPCRCAEVGSICWVSVHLPSQPTQGPLTMPQVHLEYKPNGTHLVLDRWTSLVKKKWVTTYWSCYVIWLKRTVNECSVLF